MAAGMLDIAQTLKSTARDVATEGALWALLALLLIAAGGFAIASVYIVLAANIGAVGACLVVAAMLSIGAGGVALCIRYRDDLAESVGSEGSEPMSLAQAAAMAPTAVSLLGVLRIALRRVGRNLPLIAMVIGVVWLLVADRSSTAEKASTEDVASGEDGNNKYPGTA